MAFLSASHTPTLASASTTAHEIIAVFDISVQDVRGISAENIAKFSSYLDSVVAANGYRTVPRRDLQERLVQETANSYRPCFDESCQIELGKAVAASKSLGSSWARLGRSCVLTAKLYDLRTRVAEFSAKADGECNEVGLRSAIDEIGRDLAARKQKGGYGSFKLDLDEGRAIRNPPTDQRGYLKVKAVAKDHPSEKIEVYLNGELKGTVTNGYFTKELPVGRYVLVLRTVGDIFEHQRFDIEMTTEGVAVPKSGLVELQPLTGTIVIEGSPDGATALIDGEPRPIHGVLREERSVGQHTVKIEAPGYLPSTLQQVRVVAGKEVALPRYKLVRNAGAITLTGSPVGAAVTIDRASAGVLPLQLGEVEVGEHVVEVQAPGFRPERKIVSVTRGGTSKATISLVEKKARLKVEAVVRVLDQTTPVEADVWLDGAKVGSTPWKGEVRAEVSHQIVLQLGKVRDKERVVHLSEGKEQREVLEVPSSWGGAVATVRLDVVPGPWEVRSGSAVLGLGVPNPVRPGRLPIEFLLEGKPVERAIVLLSPDEQRVVSVTGRPRSDSEMSAGRAVWTWRKWISLAIAVAAAGLAAERFAAAGTEAEARDAAVAALPRAPTQEALDAARASAVGHEDSRRGAQIVGIASITAAGVSAVWSAIEWTSGGPEPGRFEARGLDEVSP